LDCAVVNRRLGILLTLLALALLAAWCFWPQDKPPPPLETRLIEHLGEATALPDLPRVPPVFALEDWPAAPDGELQALAIPREPGRQNLLRARLEAKGGMPAHLLIYAIDAATLAKFSQTPRRTEPPLPGRFLGGCQPQLTGADPLLCGHRSELHPGDAGLLLVRSDGAQVHNLTLYDAAFPLSRQPLAPQLAALEKQGTQLAQHGRSWRASLRTGAGSRYEFPLQLPEGAQLVFATGTESGALAGPVRFIARVDGRVVFDQVQQPDSQWHEQSIPLQAAVGARVRLELETLAVPGAPGFPRGLWANPRVVGKVDAPDIVFVTIDAMRADHVGAYGYPRATTPTLDRLAAAGVLFERATPQGSNTWTSVASFLSGRQPARLGVENQGVPLPPEVPMLPDLLAAQGYETWAGSDLALFSPGQLGFFDDVEDANLVGTDGRQLPVAEQLTDLFARAKARPVFAWMHLENPHYPFYPEAPRLFAPDYQGPFATQFTMEDWVNQGYATNLSAADRQQVIALYDASLRDADETLRRILAAIEASGRSSRTIVVVSADHGTELDEHGVLVDHHVLYEPVLHVPLVIASPGHLPSGIRVSARVQLVDLAPTLLALAGLPAAGGLDGRDLSAAFHGGQLADAPAFTDRDGAHFSIFFGDEHYIASPSGKALGPPGSRAAAQPGRELFNLAQDPHELHNLFDSEPERVNVLGDLIARERARWKLDAATSTREVGMETLEMLRVAGYLGRTTAHPAGSK